MDTASQIIWKENKQTNTGIEKYNVSISLTMGRRWGDLLCVGSSSPGNFTHIGASFPILLTHTCQSIKPNSHSEKQISVSHQIKNMNSSF